MSATCAKNICWNRVVPNLIRNSCFTAASDYTQTKWFLVRNFRYHGAASLHKLSVIIRVFCMTIVHNVNPISGTQLHILLSEGQRVSYFVRRELQGLIRAHEDTEPRLCYGASSSDCVACLRTSSKHLRAVEPPSSVCACVS